MSSVCACGVVCTNNAIGNVRNRLDRKHFLDDVNNASRNFGTSSLEGKCSMVGLGGAVPRFGLWTGVMISSPLDMTMLSGLETVHRNAQVVRARPEEQKWNWAV